jgi:hypothetical protein
MLRYRVAALILLPLGGCVVMTVGAAAVSVASTVVGVGVTVGSAAVGVAGSAVKGTAGLIVN